MLQTSVCTFATRLHVVITVAGVTGLTTPPPFPDREKRSSAVKISRCPLVHWEPCIPHPSHATVIVHVPVVWDPSWLTYHSLEAYSKSGGEHKRFAGFQSEKIGVLTLPKMPTWTWPFTPLPGRVLFFFSRERNHSACQRPVRGRHFFKTTTLLF